MICDGVWSIKRSGREAIGNWHMEYRGEVLRSGFITLRLGKLFGLFGKPRWRQTGGYAPPEIARWIADDANADTSDVSDEIPGNTSK